LILAWFWPRLWIDSCTQPVIINVLLAMLMVEAEEAEAEEVSQTI
jgi:hypothetical protein